MKIAFLIASLSAGGAERVASLLCNAWIEDGHEVDVLTYQADDAPTHFKLHPDIGHFPLNLMKSSTSAVEFVRNNVLRVFALRRLLSRRRPDVLVSFITDTNVIAIVTARSLGVPVIVSERVHPGFHQIGKLREWLRARTYRWADRLVVQTGDIAAWSRNNLDVEAAIIPNPIRISDFQNAETGKTVTDSGKHLVSVGRLSPQKGYDLLIDAFAKLANMYPDWDMTIYGEGPEREGLQSKIRLLDMESRMSLPGVIDDVPRALARADLYVQPSRYEGYPNALSEALAAGLCCVATDCAGGNAELLQNGKFGLLAKPGCVADIVDKLERALGDADLRDRYANNAVEAVQGNDINVVSSVWLRLLNDTIKPSGT